MFPSPLDDFGSVDQLLILLAVHLLQLAIGGIAAIITRGKRYPESFVDRTTPGGRFVTAASGRRLLAHTLEGLLQFVTLYVGWLIWFTFVARRGQSPAKALLGLYVLDREGEPASARTMWLREVGLKVALFLVIEALLSSLLATGMPAAASIIIGAMMLRDPDKRAFWDHLAKTYVAYAPRLPQPAVEPTSTRP